MQIRAVLVVIGQPDDSQPGLDGLGLVVGEARSHHVRRVLGQTLLLAEHLDQFVDHGDRITGQSSEAECGQLDVCVGLQPHQIDLVARPLRGPVLEEVVDIHTESSGDSLYGPKRRRLGLARTQLAQVRLPQPESPLRTTGSYRLRALCASVRARHRPKKLFEPSSKQAWINGPGAHVGPTPTGVTHGLIRPL